MATEGDYFLGKEYSMIDLVLFPWFERLLTVSKAYRGFLPPETPAFDRLQRWYRAIRERPAV